MRDSSPRLFISAAAAVGALLLVTNLVVSGQPNGSGWLLVVVLIVVALAAAFWDRLQPVQRTEIEPVSPAEVHAVRRDAVTPPAVVETPSAPPAVPVEPGRVTAPPVSTPPPAAAPAVAVPPPVPTAAAAPVPAAAPAKPDDLTLIEGIGPKMSAALATAGITTFAQLAAASEEVLHAAIQEAGMRFAPSLTTWAEQASYAARGDWDGLKAFQNTLSSGRKG